MSNLLLVDDSDSIVQYSAGWDTTHAGLSQAVKNTTHCTTEAGSSVFIPFNGTGIEVVSVLLPVSQGGNPKTTYAIDGRTVVVEIEGLRDTVTAPRFNDSSFKGVGLDPGQHVLNITTLKESSPTTFCLDYFLVESQPTGSFDIGGVTVSLPTATGHPSSATRAAAAGSAGGTMGLMLIALYAVMGWSWC